LFLCCWGAWKARVERGFCTAKKGRESGRGWLVPFSKKFSFVGLTLTWLVSGCSGFVGCGVFFMIYSDKQVKFVTSHCSLSGAEVTGYHVGKLKLHEDVIGLKGLHSFAFALKIENYSSFFMHLFNP
jgi:hypothetical protein